MRRHLLLSGAAVLGVAIAGTWRATSGATLPAADQSGAAPLQARTRSRDGVTATTSLVAPAWEPAWLRTLARWQPQPPRSVLTRALAYVWAAPVTFAGVLAGLASTVVPRPTHGVLLFPCARGLTGWVLSRAGFAASALGHVIIARSEPSAALLAHELLHVRQAERLGPLFAPIYLGLLVAYGYARHPFERAARLAAQRAVSTPRQP